MLKKANVKKSSGGYARLFGNKELGELISRVHGGVVSSGHELEKIVIDEATKSRRLILDVDEFLKKQPLSEGVFVASKDEVKKCDTLTFKGSEPDFLIFKSQAGESHCHVVELKDGDTFDTKKARAESKAMKAFIRQNSKKLPCAVSAHYCCFNQTSKKAIIEGFKRYVRLEQAMTGEEFCDLLGFDYEQIKDARSKVAPSNFACFISELVKIEPVREKLKKLLQEG